MKSSKGDTISGDPNATPKDKRRSLFGIVVSGAPLWRFRCLTGVPSQGRRSSSSVMAVEDGQ
jgi:hypothetical protein